MAGSLGVIEFCAVGSALAKEADCHGFRPQLIALAQTFAREKSCLIPEFSARQLSEVYRIFAILRHDPGASFLADLDRYLLIEYVFCGRLWPYLACTMVSPHTRPQIHTNIQIEA